MANHMPLETGRLLESANEPAKAANQLTLGRKSGGGGANGLRFIANVTGER